MDHADRIDFDLSHDYEGAVAEIKSQMLPYYDEQGLIWSDNDKLELYR